MDRIDPTQYGYIQQSGTEKKKTERSNRTGKSGRFAESILKSKQSGFLDFFPSQADVTLEELLDDIHQYGENLKEKPVYSNIQTYRKAIGEFIRFVVSNGLELETVEGARLSIFKKQKKYYIINTINERLDKLAAGILQNQLAQMDILARVEEIQGLVIDLLS